MSDHEDQEDGYGLVMPFVSVRSKGGPYEDEAYVAGFEAGRMDVTLSVAAHLGLVPDTGYYVHAENASQMDLIAMSHGFTAEVEFLGDGWARVMFGAVVPTEEDGETE